MLILMNVLNDTLALWAFLYEEVPVNLGKFLYNIYHHIKNHWVDWYQMTQVKKKKPTDSTINVKRLSIPQFEYSCDVEIQY